MCSPSRSRLFGRVCTPMYHSSWCKAKPHNLDEKNCLSDFQCVQLVLFQTCCCHSITAQSYFNCRNFNVWCQDSKVRQQPVAWTCTFQWSRQAYMETSAGAIRWLKIACSHMYCAQWHDGTAVGFGCKLFLLYNSHNKWCQIHASGPQSADLLSSLQRTLQCKDSGGSVDANDTQNHIHICCWVSFFTWGCWHGHCMTFKVVSRQLEPVDSLPVGIASISNKSSQSGCKSFKSDIQRWKETDNAAGLHTQSQYAWDGFLASAKQHRVRRNIRPSNTMFGFGVGESLNWVCVSAWAWTRNV